ncbi:DNA polymerase IV [Nafulsella turpanensis]|uniref:DNA polymerase IV n=1 Tax=Nafulsella turpanensis TaxID=1265690 RepID=UPI0003625C30|nr:DNA polymerase IV [Nafulsella turpanensis]
MSYPTTSSRSILHLDLDAFFVSVERLKNSLLEGKPVIIGGTGSRGVVASCSYEARAHGISSAMPMQLARQLCPHAIYIRGDMESYSGYSRLVTDIISEKVPLLEKASIDEFYADMSGMDRFFGIYQYAQELKQTVLKEAGLPVSFGLSTSKLISKMATNEGKPGGKIQVRSGIEKEFIAPLSIKKIPSIGKVTFQQLSAMGVKKIHTLSKVPVRLLEREFGSRGRELWNKAQAIDTTPVVPYSEAKSISTERTFQQDTIDLHFLRAALSKMSEELGFRLRQHNKLTGCITVKVRYSDFNTYTRQKSIALNASDKLIQAHALELFEKLYQKRVLVRLIGLRLSQLVHGHQQISLLEDTPKEIRLYQALDYIKNKHGIDKVLRAFSL